MIRLNGQISHKRLTGKAFISKSGVGNITLEDRTVTPNSGEQIIEASDGFDGLGVVTVLGDENFIAENIKNGVEIWGIMGTSAASPFSAYGSGSIPYVHKGSATSPGLTFAGMFETFDFAKKIGEAKCYFNDVLLPGIPAAMLERLPYVWIRNDTTNGNYNLIFSKHQPWYDSSDLSIQSQSAAGFAAWYQIALDGADSASVWTFASAKTVYFGLDDARTVLWSNCDIPNGAATATEIYFEGSEPVPAE